MNDTPPVFEDFSTIRFLFFKSSTFGVTIFVIAVINLYTFYVIIINMANLCTICVIILGMTISNLCRFSEDTLPGEVITRMVAYDADLDSKVRPSL